MKHLPALLVLASLAATQAAAQETSDVEMIEGLNQQWVAAEASNDHDAAMALLWEDATMYPPNALPIQGHDGIKQLYESIVFSSLELVGPLSITVSGDVAASWSLMNYSFSLVGVEGAFDDEAKFVAVWERRNGEWKVIANAWSSNLPLPGN